MNILMGIFFMAICILVGRKMMADRGWSKRSREGSSLGGNTGKQKRGQIVGENSQSESDDEPSEELPLGPGDA